MKHRGFALQRNAARLEAGFTLIELLVVIAIIAILAAILFPVFAQAREKARAITCLSNQKQLGLGAMQYAQDYDEYNPPVWQQDGLHPWWHKIDPYVKSKAIFACPNDTLSRISGADNYGPAVSYALAFVPNDWGNCSDPAVGCTAIGNFGPAGAPSAKITSPATTILITERPVWYKGWNQVWAADNYCNYGDFLYGASGSATNPSTPRGAAIHTMGSNYAFCDGHTKWMRFEQTMVKQGNQPNWAQLQQMWQSTYTDGWRSTLTTCPTTTAPNAAQSETPGMWTIIQN